MRINSTCTVQAKHESEELRIVMVHTRVVRVQHCQLLLTIMISKLFLAKNYDYLVHLKQQSTTMELQDELVQQLPMDARYY